MVFFLLVHPWEGTIAEQFRWQNDSALYHRLACNLLDHGGFISDGTGGPPSLHPIETVGEPDDFRTPIYPLFLAAIYGLFGRAPWIAELVQILLSVASCYVLYRALHLGFSRSVALVGSLLYALDPFVMLYSVFILTETLFVFVLIAAFYAYIRWVVHARAGKEWAGYALLGLLLGLATLTRPIGQYVWLPMVALVFWSYRKRLKTAMACAAAFVAVFLITLSPWLVRNHQLFGRATLTYIGSWDLLALNVAAVEGPKRGITLEEAGKELLAEADSLMEKEGHDPATLNRLQKAVYWQDLALHYVARDPINFGLKHAQGCLFAMLNVGSAEFARALHLPANSMEGKTDNLLRAVKVFATTKSSAEIAIAVIILAFVLFTYSLTVLGLISSWRRFNPSLLLYCIVMILYFVGVVGALGNVRLKLPAMPFLMPFAGIALLWLREKWSRRRSETG